MIPWRSLRAPVLIFSTVLACAGPAENYERPLVSSGIEERTGHSIGPGAAPGDTVLPDGVAIEDGLSESEAVELALWNNPAFQEAIAELGLQRADLIQAGLLRNPVFSILFPVGPKQLEFVATLPLEALWLRDRRLNAAELDCERVAELLVEHGLNLVRDVKAAYASLELARARVALAEERAELGKRMVSVQEARLRAGDASELEVALARVTALETRTQLASFSRGLSLAENRLRGLLGWMRTDTPLRIADADPSPPDLQHELDELIREALAARPELRASELLLEAAGERAGLARVDFLRLSLLIDANSEGKNGFEIGPGLLMDLPLFDQGQGARAKAAAELEIAARHYVTVRDRIVLDVVQAHTRYLDVSEGLAAFRTEIVPALEGALRRETRAFEMGATPPLPSLEGRDRLLLARLEAARLAGELEIALAELERHVGRTLAFRAEAPPESGAGPPALSTASSIDETRTTAGAPHASPD